MDSIRDKWIKDHLPTVGGPAMAVAIEVVMKLAYNEGLRRGQELARIQHKEDERERRHGPSL